jgi:hypothetical protein
VHRAAFEEGKKTMLDAHSYRVYAYPVCQGKTEVAEAALVILAVGLI